MRKGGAAKRRSDPPFAEQLAAWVGGIETSFTDRLLPIDAAVAQLWGELSAIRSLPVVDTLIAATALTHGLTLVTRNIADFHATAVPLLNPWHAP